MAPRDRRERRGSRGQKQKASWVEASTTDRPVQQSTTSRDEEAEEANSSPLGISILKEIFPDHGSAEGGQQTLLNSIPTPSRERTPPLPATTTTPPLHALTSTTPMQSSSVSTAPTMPAPSNQSGISYRERLRAGGRGAFQRAFDVGLMPKALRQDAATTSHTMSQNTSPLSSPMSYSSMADNLAAWNGTPSMQGSDYWPSQMELPQMMEQHQMMSQFQPDQFQQDISQLPQQFQHDQFQQAWGAVAMQQPDLQAQQMPQGQLAMESMQMPQMQVQVPQMHLQQSSVDSSPTELHRCMAIIMPEAAQFPCDKSIVAAQLQAAADCQCYED